MHCLEDFSQIVLCDFEFHYGTGGSSEGPPTPICACAVEFHSGQEWRVWADQFRQRPPWPHGHDVLFVSYDAPAELRCYPVNRWPLPLFILDLLLEYRQYPRRDATASLSRRRPRPGPRAALA